MKLSEYQEKSQETAIYPKINKVPWIYPALGLSGETGEVMEKLKKIIRDENSIITDNKRKELVKELGDVLWYMAQLATSLNIDLNHVAEENLKKLKDRMNRGKLHGSGDNR